MAAPTKGYRLDSGPSPYLQLPVLIYPSNKYSTSYKNYYEHFTVEFWAYVETLNESSGVITNIKPGESWSSDGVNIYFRAVAGESVAFTVSGNYVRAGTLSTGAWNHVACVYGPGINESYRNLSIWLNGAFAGEHSGTGVNLASMRVEDPGYFWHSVYNGLSTVPFDGKVARLRFWNKPLSGQEIQAAMDMGEIPEGQSGLLAAWLLDTDYANEPAEYFAPHALLGNTDEYTHVPCGPDEGGGDSGGGSARIAGTVKIDGEAVARDVVVISDDPAGRQVVGEGESAGDGTFDITYSGWTGSVIALALDNYGQAWAAGANLNNGTVVHPTTPNGYVYQVTIAGTTGTEEPTWSTEGSVTDGSVTYEAKPYYRPVASGPLQGEPTEVDDSYQALVIELGAALYWDFEELPPANAVTDAISGAVLGVFGSGLDLTYEGVVPETTAINSPSALDYVQGFIDGMDPLNEYTVVFYAMLRARDRGLFKVGELSAYFSSGSLILGYENSGTSFPYRNSASLIPLNEWTQIAVVCNGSNARLFINGEPKGDPISWSRSITPADVSLPTDRGSLANNGAMDRFAFFPRALTDQEVLDLHNKVLDEIAEAGAQ